MLEFLPNQESEVILVLGAGDIDRLVEPITNELLMAYGNLYEIENLIELSNKIHYSKATIEDIIWENNEKK